MKVRTEGAHAEVEAGALVAEQVAQLSGIDPDVKPILLCHILSELVRHSAADRLRGGVTQQARDGVRRKSLTQQQHSCSIRVAFVQHSCSIRAAFVQHSCSIHAAFMKNSCSIHAAFIRHECCKNAAFIQHAARMPHSFSFRAAFMQLSCSNHAAFMYSKKLS